VEKRRIGETEMEYNDEGIRKLGDEEIRKGGKR